MRTDLKYSAEFATITFDGIEAGALIRRRVRSALDRARIRGADVEAYERRGLLDSVFTVRMRGTAAQLMPCLMTLAALEDGAQQQGGDRDPGPRARRHNARARQPEEVCR